MLGIIKRNHFSRWHINRWSKRSQSISRSTGGL